MANRDVGCRVVLAWNFERNLVRKLVRNFARKFARKFGHENCATKRFGKFSPQKNHPNLRLCSGTLLGKERRRPKSEMLRFCQPGRALRRFRATMSAHASKPSNVLSANLWCQDYFWNLFVKVYRWIHACFCWRQCLKSSENKFWSEKNPQGRLWELGSAKRSPIFDVDLACSLNYSAEAVLELIAVGPLSLDMIWVEQGPTCNQSQQDCLGENRGGPRQRGGEPLIEKVRRRLVSGPVLRDTARLSQRHPLLHSMGFLVSQHGQLGAIPPPSFLSFSPLESMQSGGAIPLQKGYLSDSCAKTYGNKAKTRAGPLREVIWWGGMGGPRGQEGVRGEVWKFS